MKKHSSYKEILVLLTLSVLGLFVIYYFLFLNIQKKNEHISTLENDLASQNIKEQTEASMESALKNATPDINLVDSSIVASDEDVLFIENVESLAKNNGLSVTIDSLVFTDDPRLTASQMTFFDIKMKATGGWLGTYLFLSEIENLPFKVKINGFAFTNTADTDGPDSKKTGSVGNTWESAYDLSVLKYK